MFASTGDGIYDAISEEPNDEPRRNDKHFSE